MGLISPAQITDGTTIDASDVNNPINTIANEFNGNIDNNNVKAGAGIATSKLAAGVLSVPTKFSVCRNAAWTSGSPSKVAYDTKLFDTGTNVDIVTNVGRFTAPTAGFYWFSASAAVTISGGNATEIFLYKNSSVILQGTSGVQGATGGFQASAAVSGILQLSANDFIEVQFYGSGAAGAVGSASTYFQGFLLST